METFGLLDILQRRAGQLIAQFAGIGAVTDAMFLSESKILLCCFKIKDFNLKSINWCFSFVIKLIQYSFCNLLSMLANKKYWRAIGKSDLIAFWYWNSFLLDIKFRFFVYLTQSKASSNHSTGAGPKIQSHHESLRAYRAPSRKGSRDPHQFPLLSAWKKGWKYGRGDNYPDWSEDQKG